MTFGIMSGFSGNACQTNGLDGKHGAHYQQADASQGASGLFSSLSGGGKSDLLSGLLSEKFNLVNNLLGGITGGATNGGGYSSAPPESTQPNTIGGCTSNTASTSYSNTHSANDFLDNLAGAKQGLLGGVFSKFSGAEDAHSKTGTLGNLGSFAGGAAQTAHHAAETVIHGSGLGSFFEPIDDAVVHPLLWDPISKATGVDVSSHPGGVNDVSNPLGLKRG